MRPMQVTNTLIRRQHQTSSATRVIRYPIILHDGRIRPIHIVMHPEMRHEHRALRPSVVGLQRLSVRYQPLEDDACDIVLTHG